MIAAARLPLCAAALALALAGTLPGAATAQQATPGIPVQVGTASRQDVPVELRNVGSVEANMSVLVRARVDGELQQVFFTEGQDVKAGDKLAIIDPRPYAATLAAAVAKKAGDEQLLADAERNLVRYSNLVRSDFTSRQQYDTQTATVGADKAQIESDAAAIESARLNLEYCTIISPIDGRVGLRLLDPGNMVQAASSQNIVMVNQIHPIAMVFTLPQDNLPQIQAAMARGTVPVGAYPSEGNTKLAEGTLLTVDNSIDRSTGTFRLKAMFANTDNHLWPGQFVNARAQVGLLKNVVTVPSVAVQRGPNGLYVFLVKPDSTVTMRPVQVPQDDGNVAVITAGLDAGASVVTNGQSRLQDGNRVTVVATPAGGS